VRRAPHVHHHRSASPHRVREHVPLVLIATHRPCCLHGRCSHLRVHQCACTCVTNGRFSEIVSHLKTATALPAALSLSGPQSRGRSVHHPGLSTVAMCLRSPPVLCTGTCLVWPSPRPCVCLIPWYHPWNRRLLPAHARGCAQTATGCLPISLRAVASINRVLRPASSYCSFWLPASMYLSGSTIGRTLSFPSSRQPESAR